jgi:hypothetical protein
VKYFLDTEFIESGPKWPLELLSIGIVAEDGREFYAENGDAPTHHASEWVKENVLPHLSHEDDCYSHDWGATDCCVVVGWEFLGPLIKEFCDPETYGKPEFWGYYADYDWVALCQLFGTMMDLPPGWPKYCLDIKQLAVLVGNPKLPEQGRGEHHALADARWNKVAYEFVREYFVCMLEDIVDDRYVFADDRFSL